MASATLAASAASFAATHSQQWGILKDALARHGPLVWAIAAPRDIRTWTPESLAPTPLTRDALSYSRAGVESVIAEEARTWVNQTKKYDEIIRQQTNAGAPAMGEPERAASGANGRRSSSGAGRL